MDTKTAYNLLRKIQQQLNPEYIASKNPSTFLIVELVENEEGIMELTTSVIDPHMGDKGDAKAYLALEPQQRTIVELSNLINAMTSGVATIAKHAPHDKRVLVHTRGNLNDRCELLRQLSAKAAITCLTESNDTGFDVAIKAKISIPGRSSKV